MPIFTPGRRWQPAYYPFHNEPFYKQILAWLERTVKGPLFGCRMCGNCLLQETAFICPMECPKGLRNGPCGGSTPDHCYVDPTRPCIWYRIYDRAEKMGRLDRLMEILPPLDWDKVGTDQWLDVAALWQKTFGVNGSLKLITAPQEERNAALEHFFYALRQPPTWQGDALPHPAPAHKPVSTLEEKLCAGQFVVTAEISPPISASPDELNSKFTLLHGYVDAVNFTDNPSATSRMSPLAASVACLQFGIEPIMQIAARDYNRMGVQSMVLGAAMLGIHNILCLTGDHSRLGPQPHSRMDIWDIDSIQLIWMLRCMRDEGRFLDQRNIEVRPPVFIGAASSPFSSRPSIQAHRETKKANAGAQFFQTNLIYDVEHFEQYMAMLDHNGVAQRVHILAGVAPIRSLKAAQAMRKIPGIHIPDAILQRLENSKAPKEEGIQIALETIEQLKSMPGIKGIHFMAVGWEKIVPRLIIESGLVTPAAHPA
ncbi:MAG: methylenetetrahydrofolate reductase C-terminal domain-containing protein [Anaerolineaceae bacterium]|nr:methylenetetrahydrofolate reductase C-terminal domain-containing protein [Anaerolineaceae bacterium]